MLDSAVRFDLDRERRIGLPEAVFCAGKPFDTLAGLFARFALRNAPPVLFTRLDAEVFAKIDPDTAGKYNFDPLSRTAGLDAALASVLGGLTMRPLFAVPTSIGYGIAQGGETALRSMLASCAPGVAVLNIDNGYGAACAAARVLAALYPQAPSETAG